MNRIGTALLVLIIMAACVPSDAIAAGNQQTRPGSFLRHRADSAKALADQVSSKSIVGRRYAQHFNTSPESLKRYFQENLQLITLKRPMETTVYYLSKNGGIGQSKRLLPAGTRVFATKNGEPLLEWRCGNPLTKRLPVTVAKAKPAKSTAAKPSGGGAETAAPEVTEPETEPVEMAEALDVVETPEVQVAAAQPMEIGQIPATTIAIPATETLPTTVMPSIVATVEPALEAAVAVPTTTVPPTVVASSGGGFPWIIPLVLGGGAQLFRDAGGGDNPPPPVPEPEPVPEPGAISVFSGGLATFALAYRMRRKK